MPIFVGPQDTGKNFMLEVFALVIGSWNYLSTTNLEVLYGNHAELAAGKLLVNMDKIDAHSTKPYQSRIKKDVDNQTKKHVNRKFEGPTHAHPSFPLECFKIACFARFKYFLNSNFICVLKVISKYRCFSSIFNSALRIFHSKSDIILISLFRSL